MLLAVNWSKINVKDDTMTRTISIYTVFFLPQIAKVTPLLHKCHLIQTSIMWVDWIADKIMNINPPIKKK